MSAAHAQGGQPTLAENIKLVVFKDRKKFLFYSDCMAAHPRDSVPVPDEQPPMFRHELVPTPGWLGRGCMRRPNHFVLALVVAYNLFVNMADGFDQLCSTTVTMPK